MRFCLSATTMTTDIFLLLQAAGWLKGGLGVWFARSVFSSTDLLGDNEATTKIVSAWQTPSPRFTLLTQSFLSNGDFY